MALVNEQARVIANENVGPRLWIITLKSPTIARQIEPGQFVHMRIPQMNDHILRRPFSVYARSIEHATIEILYQVVGFGSEHLTTICQGDTCELIGPVGYGWTIPEGARKALLVGGGVGSAPLYLFAEQLVSQGIHVDFIMGAQTSRALVTKERYTRLLGVEPQCSTDDGSYGRAGFCTSLVEEALTRCGASEDPYDFACVCGPEPLMKIVANMCEHADVACFVSLEKRMACGIGACLSCVVDTTEGKKRACVDGPVFDARKVVW